MYQNQPSSTSNAPTLLLDSTVIKTVKNEVLGHLLKFFAASALAIVLLPILDRTLFNSDKPTALTFAGVGLIISLNVIALVKWGLATTFALPKKLTLITTWFFVFVILTKIVAGPIALYITDPVLDVDLSKDKFFAGDLSNFNSSWLVLLAMAWAIFLMYAVIFKVLAKKHQFNLVKYLGVPADIKIKKKRNLTLKTILLIIALCVLTGGMVLVLVVFLVTAPLVSIEPTTDYLKYIFTGIGGLMVAISLSAAIAYAKMTLIAAEEQAKAIKSIQFFTTFVWACVAVLLVFHALWAMYLFVLTTLWPFKVFTHGVAPK